MKKDAKSGFTLIEVLVVIAIIGLLASLITSQVVAVRGKANDSRRLSDLNQIKKALELYWQPNEKYPPAPCEVSNDPDGDGYNCNNYYHSYIKDTSNPRRWAILESYLSPYLPQLPVDPINSGVPWCGPSGCGGTPSAIQRYGYTYGNVIEDSAPRPPLSSSIKLIDQYDLTTALQTPDHPNSCGITKQTFWYNGINIWCTAHGGLYSNQVYEGSPLLK